MTLLAHLADGFIGGHPITDANQSNEVLFSMSATTPVEVDEMASKVVEAGGTLYSKPGYKDGWMYGCGFTDLDGHRWNILNMDMSKMPQQMRKSVDDISRRADVSTRNVEHNAEALALANVDENLSEMIQPTLVRKKVANQIIRSLDPLGKDGQ